LVTFLEFFFCFFVFFSLTGKVLLDPGHPPLRVFIFLICLGLGLVPGQPPFRVFFFDNLLGIL